MENEDGTMEIGTGLLHGQRNENPNKRKFQHLLSEMRLNYLNKEKEKQKAECTMVLNLRIIE